MARGVPVATSGRASLAEVAGDAALLFDPEDEALDRGGDRALLGDAALRERLRAAGRERSGAASPGSAPRTLTVAAYRRALAER